MISLGQLKEIKDLREVWPHEALDFTPWLAEEKNLALLADAVGLEITVDETESKVGDFNVDIYATETGTERRIILRLQQQSQVGVELYINDDKELFRSLYERKAEIEADVGAELDWRELPEKKASRILIKRDANLTDEQEWPQQFDWVMDKLVKMKKAFKKYI